MSHVQSTSPFLELDYECHRRTRADDERRNWRRSPSSSPQSALILMGLPLNVRDVLSDVVIAVFRLLQRDQHGNEALAVGKRLQRLPKHRTERLERIGRFHRVTGRGGSRACRQPRWHQTARRLYRRPSGSGQSAAGFPTFVHRGARDDGHVVVASAWRSRPRRVCRTPVGSRGATHRRHQEPSLFPAPTCSHRRHRSPPRNRHW